MLYSFEKVKEAILFNTREVLPSDPKTLDAEIKFLVDNANQSGQPIKHYIGFEVSGRIHFPGSVYLMLQVAKLQQAGILCHILLADYHTMLNKKLDGNIETITKVAKTYFEPVLKASLQVVGGDPDKLVFLSPKTSYFEKNSQGLTFWDFEFQADKHLSLSRILRSLSIMGKEAGKDVDYQLTRYPGMQVADVFWLQTHIVQSSLDQRKIYVSSRDIALKLEENYQLKINGQAVKPICTFSNLLLSLEKPKQTSNDDGLTSLEVSKMSKSKPDSAIWVHDSLEEIQNKLKKAYCPAITPDQSAEEISNQQSNNPILNWCQHFIFPGNKEVKVIRNPKYGKNQVYSNFASLQKDYFSGLLHPLDLKNAVAVTLAEWFEPIRKTVLDQPEGLKILESLSKSGKS